MFTGLTFKILGAVGILLATAGLIFIRVWERKEKISVVADFVNMFFLMCDLIDSKRLCIEEVFCEVIKKAGQSRDFFEYIYKYLGQEDNPSLVFAWEKGIELYRKKSLLLPGTVEILKKVGMLFGSVCAEMELKNLGEIRDELIFQKKQMTQDFEKETKIFVSLGFALGGVIILIFI